MKNHARKLLTAVLAAVMLALCFASLAATAVAVPTVTVNATATLEVEPDIAYISLGVSTTEKTAEAAKKNNTTIMNRVLNAVRKENVSEKDMQTSLSMRTNYTWDKDYTERTITGYTVDNTLTITVRDIDKVGDIVDAAMNAGANEFHNVRFDLEDDEAYFVQALSDATKMAKKRANAMVTAAGGKLGDVASMSMGNVSFNPIYDYPEEDVDQGMADEALPETGSGSSNSIGSTIQSGTITVSATVTVAYRVD